MPRDDKVSMRAGMLPTEYDEIMAYCRATGTRPGTLLRQAALHLVRRHRDYERHSVLFESVTKERKNAEPGPQT